MAWEQMNKMPEKMRDEVYWMLQSSDDGLDNLITIARIVRMQCLIRSFLARRRVATMKKAKSDEPSDYAKV